MRLNRDRLKGSSGEAEALLGLNVLFEVLLTMSQIMSPFTPFFAEYLYQNLRKLQPFYGNTDESVAIDSSGNRKLKLLDMILADYKHYCDFSSLHRKPHHMIYHYMTQRVTPQYTTPHDTTPQYTAPQRTTPQYTTPHRNTSRHSTIHLLYLM